MRSAIAALAMNFIARGCINMSRDLKWQSPTSWSRETLDGEYYVEKVHRSVKWDACSRKKNLGRFPSLKEAKEACQLHKLAGE